MSTAWMPLPLAYQLSYRLKKTVLGCGWLFMSCLLLLQSPSLAQAQSKARGDALQESSANQEEIEAQFPPTFSTARADATGPLRAIKRLITEVLASHPSAQAAKLGEALAAAEISSAKAQFWFTPSLSAERVNKTASANTDESLVTLRLQQPLWTGLRLTRQLDRARVSAQLAQTNAENEKLKLALRILDVWSDAQNHFFKRQLHNENQTRHAKFLQQVERRLSRGLAPASDATFARSRLLLAQSDFAQSNAQFNLAIGRFTQIVGRALTAAEINVLFSPLPWQPTFVLPSVQTIMSQVLAQHPELLRARQEIQLQQVNVKLANAKLSPEIFLRSETVQGNVSGQTNRIFVGLTSSLGAGLSSINDISAAKIREQAAHSEYEIKRLQIEESIYAEYSTADNSAARIEVLRAALNDAQDVVVGVERQYLAGRRPWQDVMNSAREKTQSGIQFSDLDAQYRLSVLRLQLLSNGLQAYLAAPD